MAKCIRCGKKGLFLKINNFGLCSDCQNLADLERESKNQRPNIQTNVTNQTANKPNKVEKPNKSRMDIPAEIIDSMQRIEASSEYKNIIYNKYYSDYPEKPYISQDREFNTDWIEQADMFPKQSIISKSMMKRYADGLLPGHIYMLYWLKKYKNKRIPAYFEYKYGVDFVKETIFLHDNGFLDDLNKPTEKGEKAINRHHTVIEKHTPPKPDRSIEGISKQILAQRDSILKNGFTEYIFIANSGCCESCSKLNNKHFPVSELKIGVNAPPMHDKCRCSIAAWEDDEEYEAWLDFLSKGGTTKQWNASGRAKWEKQKNGGKAVAKSSGNGIISLRKPLRIDMQYFAKIPPDKINKFLLNPGAKHSKEFFDVGYKESDYELLVNDLLNGFSNGEIVDRIVFSNDVERFSIFMQLGVKKKKRFRSVWQKDTPESEPRLITAHRED